MSQFALTGLLSLPSADIDALWRLGDGRAALLYLFIRKNDRLPTEQEAADCGFTSEALFAARKLLTGAGLISAIDTRPDDKPPVYEAGEIAGGITRDSGFALVVSAAERLSGKLLSSADLQTLYSIYDWRGLPPEVLTMLLHFCHTDFEKRLRRKPTMKSIGAEAALWEKAGIFTVEAAERHIKWLNKLRSDLTKALRAVGIHGREPSATEKRYIESWLQMGFPPDTIAIAYDKTVTQRPGWAWAYCDKILQTWHQAGLHTPEEAAQESKKPPRPPNPAVKSNRPIGPPGQAEQDAMRRALAYLHNDGEDE
jgi:hypothetical protein